MSDAPQPERKLSDIVPTNPYAGFPTTAHAAFQKPDPTVTSLPELMTILASKSFNEVKNRAAEHFAGEGEGAPKVAICFSESVAEIRSLMTNVVAFIDKGHFDKAANALGSATFSMFVLGHILDQESDGKFGLKLGNLLAAEEKP